MLLLICEMDSTLIVARVSVIPVIQLLIQLNQFMAQNNKYLLTYLHIPIKVYLIYLIFEITPCNYYALRVPSENC